ncbi:MAG TPA: hypothetical protein VH062_00900 [Polyangiaceae bacterium]|jgi:hypothetical protein|nr:hypothetical protein [Polyangiaceae bacterium]
MRSSTQGLCTALSSSLVVGLLLAATPAHAQIREPGNHPKYSVELEPHLVVQWQYADWDSDGIGIGGRVSIPVMDNGPITTINNSFAVGVGLDWAHFDDNCNAFYGVRVRPNGFGGCTANHFWIPMVAQWNFWFTPVVSAFAELGLAIQHASYDVACDPGTPTGICAYSDSYTRVRPVFLVGPRFTLTNSFAITLRVGVPYLTIGGSFYL